MYITLLKFLFAAMAVEIALTPWGTTYVRVAGYALILFSYFLPTVALRQGGERNVRVSTLCVIEMGIVIVASLIYSTSGITFDLLKAILAFLCMYWAIDVRPQHYTKRDLKEIFLINKLLSLIYIAYSFLPFPFRYTLANEWGYYAFTLNMGNTNSTSIYMLFSLMLLVIELTQTSIRWQRFLLLCMSACLIYIIVLLKSRMVLACSVVTIMFVFPKRIRLRRWHAYLGVFIPVAAIFLQMRMGSIGEIIIMGKPLASGRANLFEEYISLLGNDPWSYILGRIGQHKLNNYHNAPLAILMNLGIVGYVCYVVFWCYTLRTAIEQSTCTRIQTVATMCLLVFFVHSAAEAAPMIGMVRYGVPIIVLSRLMKDVLV